MTEKPLEMSHDAPAVVSVSPNELSQLLAVATMYVDAFRDDELVTLPEKLALQDVEAILEKYGRRPAVHTAAAMTGEELHEIFCNDSRPCARWLGGNSGHRDFYRDRAAELTERLGPEIGAGNVKLAVGAVVEVLL